MRSIYHQNCPPSHVIVCLLHHHGYPTAALCPFSLYSFMICFLLQTYARVFSFIATIDRHRHPNETADFMKKNSSFQPLINFFETNLSDNMGANDSPTTTRSIITDYFDWRLNNRTINNRLFFIVRKIASESEEAYRNQQTTLNFHFSSSSSPIDLQTLNNIKDIHNEIAKELFNDGGISWGRIITFISFSAILAENVIRQQTNNLSTNLIIASVIDWTTNYIDTELQTWLQSQNYWSGCLKLYDKPPQRRNSISRYAGILGTIGMLTLGAFYMRRT